MKKNIFIGFKLRSRNSLYLMLAFTFLMVHQSFAQNHYCESSSAIYSNLNNEFEASVNVGNAQAGPYYDCLATQPNPSWFHFQISQGGDLEIAIQNSSNIDINL